jgi:hypothetical protein
MSNDPEIMPPSKRGLPARRDQTSAVSRTDTGLPRPGGVVSSWLTGFGAKLQAETYKEIAANIRAQKDVLDAENDRRESALTLLRTTHKLEEAPDILALDRAERRTARAAKYAELTAKYEQIDYDRDERKHQAELTKLRRERELQEARQSVVEANRGVFNAEQGLENQQRLKQLNLEMWEKLTATEQLDAVKTWMLASREIDEMKQPAQRKAEEGPFEQLAEMRATLNQQAQEATARGDAILGEKYEQLGTQLDELLVAALRTQTKK